MSSVLKLLHLTKYFNFTTLEYHKLSTLMIQTKNNHVVCFGEVLWDMLPEGPTPGGAPMNVAIHLKNMGIDVDMVSRVGDDSNGNKLKAFLKASGIQTTYIQTDPRLPTSTVLVKLDSQNNASYEICEPVAWDNIEMRSELIDLKNDAGIIIFGTLSSRSYDTRNTLSNIIKSEAIKVLDINLRPPYENQEVIDNLIRKADIAKLNEDELSVVSAWNSIPDNNEKSMIKALSEIYNLSLIIVTRGENGAIVYTKGNFSEHKGYPVAAIDTVGAGDSFLASFIGNLITGSSIERCLDFACATGALVATQKGATPEYKTSDILSIINRNKP